MKTKAQIVAQLKKHKAISNQFSGKQDSNTKECEAFYAGDFMSYQDTIQFSDTRGSKKKAMVQFNRVKPYVNAVKGFMAQQRRKSRYAARLDDDKAQQLYSDYANAVADYVRDNANADQAESTADRDMLVRGIGCIETCMTYGDGYASSDPNGEILYIPIDNPFFDPYARRQNIIDSRWTGYDKVYGLEEALELFDKSEPDDFESAADEDSHSEIKLDKRTGANWRALQGYDWSNEEEKTVNVTFYQWYDIETYWRCQNPLYQAKDPSLQLSIQMILDGIDSDDEEFNPRAEIIICNNEIKSQLEDAFGDSIEFFKVKRKVFYTAVCSGDVCFDSYKSISQSCFSIQFKTGDYDAKNKIWTGMVNSMKEPTLYYNKALTELMFIIASNAKGGVLVERGAVTDVRDFESKYAKTDSVIVVEDGAISGQKIMPKRVQHQPSGYEDIVSLSDAAISEVNGIDKSFLGSSESKQETAALQRNRIRQVVSSLACYFDSITLFQKENARLLLDFLLIYAENNPGALIPILGENGKTQFMKLASDPFMVEYGITIQEAPQTPDEKREYAELLTQMADKLISVGDIAGKALYAVAIKYLPISKADAQKISSILMPDEGEIDPAYVKQLEQTVQQLQQESNMAMIENTKSLTGLNIAKAGEAKAKVQKFAAETTKTLEDADQTNLENKYIRKHPDTMEKVT